MAELLPGGFHAFAPQSDFLDNAETNTSRPLTDAVITVRIIKSFEYRSMKAYVLKGVNLTRLTVAELEEKCRQEVKTSPSFKAFRSFADKLDTLKLYTRAHGAKTTNLIINLDHPDWILDDTNLPTLSSDPAATRFTATLASLGIENETELSFFNRELYLSFLEHPQTKWDETG